MQAYICIEGFGKIKKAKINIGDYTIFIGTNNSGKTYLMQLIYGILQKMRNISGIYKYIDLKYNDGFEITRDDTEKVENAINLWLEEQKDKIVKEVFHSDINVKKISFEIKAIDYTYKISKSNDRILNKKEDKEDDRYIYEIYANKSLRAGIRIMNFSEEKLTDYFISFIMLDIFNMSSALFNRRNSIFLPASRSGLMLLYSNFFSTDKPDSVKVIDNDNEETENEFGLTSPVYDFLLFLQEYKISEINSRRNKEIIDFINNNLIDGRLNKSGNTMYYTPNNTETSIPIYLSSSMINELTPIIQVLSGISNISYIMYDEVETCLHPLKQIQMARLLNRLVNSGRKLIISTHSDTMASAINNLILLSSSPNKDNLLKKLNYQQDDLLKTENIHIYQFTNDGNETHIKELENNSRLGIGYDFELFNQSNDKIYRDAKEILGVN